MNYEFKFRQFIDGRMNNTLGLVINTRGKQMNPTIGNVTDADFASEVLESSSPVLVDYWAEWCGPCKMIEPALNEAATSYASRVNIVRLNVDENQSTPSRYGVRGIPTLMLFRGGDIIATKVGALSKSQLADFLDSHL